MKSSATFLALLALTCVAEAELPTAAGIHELTLPDSGRRFTLSVPRGYTGGEPVPLILSLHYGGRVTPYFGRGLLESLVEPALRKLGAIIVAPDSTAGGWTNAESERNVLELLEYIGANYNVDSRRTLVTGYSMGGAGTWYMAARHPERFTAALVMAGRPEQDLAHFAWDTPMYVIHSRADELIPLGPAEAAVAELQSRGASIELVVIDRITHFQMALYRPHLAAAIPWLRSVWGG